MLHYCELFPSHINAVSETNVNPRLVVALTPKRGSGSKVKQVGINFEQKSYVASGLMRGPVHNSTG